MPRPGGDHATIASSPSASPAGRTGLPGSVSRGRGSSPRRPSPTPDHGLSPASALSPSPPPDFVSGAGRVLNEAAAGDIPASRPGTRHVPAFWTGRHAGIAAVSTAAVSPVPTPVPAAGRISCHVSRHIMRLGRHRVDAWQAGQSQTPRQVNPGCVRPRSGFTVVWLHVPVFSPKSLIRQMLYAPEAYQAD